MGWIVEQHGALYAQEFGWSSDFEGLVAGIVSRLMARFDPARERVWIAELDGQRVGSVALVRKRGRTAQLRLLLVMPQARGLGLGERLTDVCIDSARELGYRRIELWTNSCLLAARGIYAKRGFRRIATEAYEGFGQALTSETWRLELPGR